MSHPSGSSTRTSVSVAYGFHRPLPSWVLCMHRWRQRTALYAQQAAAPGASAAATVSAASASPTLDLEVGWVIAWNIMESDEWEYIGSKGVHISAYSDWLSLSCTQTSAHTCNLHKYAHKGSIDFGTMAVHTVGAAYVRGHMPTLLLASAASRPSVIAWYHAIPHCITHHALMKLTQRNQVHTLAFSMPCRAYSCKDNPEHASQHFHI